ncbi:MAG: hypothetical protein BIFFINMI_00658 [Phycisphaerae bacterium]|nr:hypothetical protein [Phycisphaerae bacterium]
MAPQDANAYLVHLRERAKQVKNLLSRSRSNQVHATSIKSASKEAVAFYFKESRLSFAGSGLDNESLASLDKWFQELLTHTQKASLKTGYARTLKSIEQELNGVEVALLSASPSAQTSPTRLLDGREERIASTLGGLVASAGLSYEQGCIDLRDGTRRSYRGAATELREALREALDHLAPDVQVTSQASFKLEDGQKKPTMKQKVRFILASRGKNKTQTSPAENSTSLVEDRVGALARSVYDRSSLSTHVGTTKQEVQQVKAYVDVVLTELLEIA